MRGSTHKLAIEMCFLVDKSALLSPKVRLPIPAQVRTPAFVSIKPETCTMKAISAPRGISSAPQPHPPRCLHSPQSHSSTTATSSTPVTKHIQHPHGNPPASRHPLQCQHPIDRAHHPHLHCEAGVVSSSTRTSCYATR